MDNYNKTLEKKERILVYDTTKAYSRLINLYFSEEYDIVVLTNQKKMLEVDLSSFDKAIAVLNCNEDLDEVMYLRSRISSLYIGSDIDYIKDFITNLDNVTLVDLHKRRVDIIDFLKTTIFSKSFSFVLH